MIIFTLPIWYITGAKGHSRYPSRFNNSIFSNVDSDKENDMNNPTYINRNYVGESFCISAEKIFSEFFGNLFLHRSVLFLYRQQEKIRTLVNVQLNIEKGTEKRNLFWA